MKGSIRVEVSMLGLLEEENSGRVSLSAPQNRDGWHIQGLMM